MKLVRHEVARITRLVDVVRPKGQLYLPEAAVELTKRYKFVDPPNKIEDLLINKIEFKHGKFGDTGIENLSVYSDGISVASRCNTKILEAFLEDLMDWAKETFEFEFVLTKNINKTYDSNIVVELDKQVLDFFEPIQVAANKVASKVNELSGIDVKLQPFGFSFAVDPAYPVPLKPIPFRIERLVSSDFGLNIFYSSASLKTDDHIEILEDIEFKLRQC